jgi:hypothetical protein
MWLSLSVLLFLSSVVAALGSADTRRSVSAPAAKPRARVLVLFPSCGD